MNIPKIIHQIYLQGWSSLPQVTQKSIAQLRYRNPDWEYRFYDADAAEDFILANFSGQVVSAYLKINPSYYACRADFLRYLILYQLGGIYLDIKSTSVMPLSDMLMKEDQYLLAQWPPYRDKPAGTQDAPELTSIPGGEFVNWLIAAEPKHEFLRAVIGCVCDNINSYQPFKCGVGKAAVLRLSGPIAYTLAINPIIKNHRHRFIAYEDFGIAYSIHGSHNKHEKLYGKHYSELVNPIVQTCLFSTFFSILWFGRIKPAARFVMWKIDGLRRRIRSFH